MKQRYATFARSLRCLEFKSFASVVQIMKVYDVIYECEFCGQKIKRREVRKDKIKEKIALPCTCQVYAAPQLGLVYTPHTLAEVSEQEVKFVHIYFNNIPQRGLKARIRKRKEEKKIKRIIEKIDELAKSTFHWFNQDSGVILSFYTNKWEEIDKVLKNKGYCVSIIEPKH